MAKDQKYIAKMMGVKGASPMHVDLSTTHIPEIKDWNIGQEVTVTFTGKVKSLNQSYNGKNISACVQVGDNKLPQEEIADDY